GWRRRTKAPSLPPPRGRRLGTVTTFESWGIGADGDSTRTSEIRLPARVRAWSVTRAAGSPLGSRLVRTQTCTARMLGVVAARRLSAHGAVEEGGHLSACDRLVGAVVVVGGWVAAAGDVGGGEGVDVGLEDGVVVVVESVGSMR